MSRKKGSYLTIFKKILILCFLILFILVLGNSLYRGILKKARTEEFLSSYQNQVALLAGEELIPYSFPSGSDTEGYYFGTEKGELFLFSHFWAPYVTGYGGPFKLLIKLSPEHVINEIYILEHNETPEWIAKTADWLKKLEGLSLLSLDDLEEVDTVTGATYTTRGILKVLKKTGSGLAGVLGMRTQEEQKKPLLVITFPFILMTGLMAGAVFLRRKPQKVRRHLFMILVVLLLGFWLNLQFSTYHILAFALGNLFWAGLDKNLFFYLFLPLGLLFTGNIYCGYLCPFGLFQELTGELLAFMRIKLPGKVDQAGRLLKYFLLILILLSCLFKELEPFREMDILLSAFDLTSGMAAVGLFLFLGALVPRFWCRYICPTGAGLSLLHSLHLFLYKKWGRKLSFWKKTTPIPHVKHCDLGIQNMGDNNCLCCDRCRYARSPGPEKQKIEKSRTKKSA